MTAQEMATEQDTLEAWKLAPMTLAQAHQHTLRNPMEFRAGRADNGARMCAHCGSVGFEGALVDGEWVCEASVRWLAQHGGPVRPPEDAAPSAKPKGEPKERVAVKHYDNPSLRKLHLAKEAAYKAARVAVKVYGDRSKEAEVAVKDRKAAIDAYRAGLRAAGLPDD